MVIKLDVPDSIFDDASAQLGGDKLAIQKRMKTEIACWAKEFREDELKKEKAIDTTDISGFLNG